MLAGCGRLGLDDPPVGAPCDTDTTCAPCERCDTGHCAAETIDELYVGHRTTCFIGRGGSRWCVGEDPGIGDATPPLFPVRLADDPSWTLLAPGWSTSQGVRAGELYQWTDAASVPAEVDADGNWVAITTELTEFCYRRGTGEAMCAGSAVPGAWLDVEVGEAGPGAAAFCGIQTDHSLWCWGIDTSNDLGHGIDGSGATIAPADGRVGTDTDWAQIGVGNALACARKLDGTVWCWGDAMNTGTNGVDTLGVPTQVSPRTDWASVGVRWQHACARAKSGEVDCWGTDDYGLDVVPGSASVAVPTALPMTWERFEMGGHHYCGYANGAWTCWGWNAAGQLGIGTTTTQNAPSTSAAFCTQGD